MPGNPHPPGTTCALQHPRLILTEAVRGSLAFVNSFGEKLLACGCGGGGVVVGNKLWGGG